MSETELDLCEAFAEAFVWKCERELLSEEDRLAGKKLDIGLFHRPSMKVFDLSVVAKNQDSGDDGFFDTPICRLRAPRILVADPEAGYSFCGAAIQFEATKQLLSLGSARIPLSDPRLSLDFRRKAKEKLFEKVSIAGASVALRLVSVDDPVKLVSEWMMNLGGAT